MFDALAKKSLKSQHVIRWHTTQLNIVTRATLAEHRCPKCPGEFLVNVLIFEVIYAFLCYYSHIRYFDE